MRQRKESMRQVRDSANSHLAGREKGGNDSALYFRGARIKPKSTQGVLENGNDHEDEATQGGRIPPRA